MTQPTPPAEEDVPAWVGAVMRTCIACHKTDNHPKVIMAAVGNMPSADVYWHHDCYVIATADGWESIKETIAGAEGRKGHQLRLHLMRRREDAPRGGPVPVDTPVSAPDRPPRGGNN